MGFKLGKARQPRMVGGTITKGLSFHQESGDPSVSVPGTPVIRKPLAEGIMGEANMDGTIFINENITPGSEEERQVINHEMRHATDMKLGKLAYDDNSVTYNGERFERKTINGKDMIIVDGVAKEAGSEGFPWEREANNGNHHGTV
mgnify:FL=1|jgi:hypothetical protein|tara:strand:+ start:317 stop:754 length:438 start_codon:yes stop_codon:yes gene_type:complete